MRATKVYQDLSEAGLDEKARMEFILAAINDHKSSKLYRDAVVAEKYFDGENVTIARYEKLIYDMMGRAHRDMYTANHKIEDKFFPMFVNQKVSYLLGNGVSFDGDNWDKLGNDFDQRIMEAAECASWGGVAFGFYNLNRLLVFKVTEFVPLYDEETSALKAGIRFWQVDDTRPLRATLYELDGYTEYIKQSGEDMAVFRPKRSYIVTERTSEADGTEIVNGENYSGFPIVPLRNNRKGYSDLRGKRNTLDALDLACSNMVNNVDEGNLIYWVISNCGGMDDLDDAKFIDRVRTTKVVHTENGDGTAEPHTIEAPFQGTQATIDMLTKRLYDDFQAFDASAVSAGNQTATAIKASYVPLDLKCDLFEAQVTDFINSILSLAGIEDKPSYTRNKIVNTAEEVQTITMAAPYLSEDYITEKILTLLGDADRVEEVQKQKSAEEMNRISTVREGAEDVIVDET